MGDHYASHESPRISSQHDPKLKSDLVMLARDIGDKNLTSQKFSNDFFVKTY